VGLREPPMHEDQISQRQRAKGERHRVHFHSP